MIYRIGLEFIIEDVIRIYYDMINTNIPGVHNRRCELPTK